MGMEFFKTLFGVTKDYYNAKKKATDEDHANLFRIKTMIDKAKADQDMSTLRDAQFELTIHNIASKKEQDAFNAEMNPLKLRYEKARTATAENKLTAPVVEKINPLTKLRSSFATGRLISGVPWISLSPEVQQAALSMYPGIDKLDFTDPAVKQLTLQLSLNAISPENYAQAIANLAALKNRGTAVPAGTSQMPPRQEGTPVVEGAQPSEFKPYSDYPYPVVPGAVGSPPPPGTPGYVPGGKELYGDQKDEQKWKKHYSATRDDQLSDREKADQKAAKTEHDKIMADGFKDVLKFGTKIEGAPGLERTDYYTWDVLRKPYRKAYEEGKITFDELMQLVNEANKRVPNWIPYVDKQIKDKSKKDKTNAVDRKISGD